MTKHSAARVPQSAVVIVGAGPAGASLAIRLATVGHSVTLVEKESFPREKLCGEFISPECFRHFAELGVQERLLSLGGARIAETRFFDAGGRSVSVPTSWFGHGDFALSLSRARMDEALLMRAKELGVKVIECARAVGVEAADGRIKAVIVKTDSGRFDVVGDLFVDATGRAAALSRLLEKPTDSEQPQKPKMVAFKNHLTGTSIERDACEIYVFDGGYGGLSPIEGGKANLCFIVRSEVAKDISRSIGRQIEIVASRNRRATETLRDAVTAGDWLAVPIGSFGRANRPKAQNLISIGDAAAFIDPFTGSGMLMALESAELLAGCAREQSVSSPDLARVYGRLHARKFRNRLTASAVLRRAAFMPKLAAAAIAATGASDLLRERLAKATRSGSRGRERRV
jgi:menaquinone-9 beta-reductase